MLSLGYPRRRSVRNLVVTTNRPHERGLVSMVVVSHQEAKPKGTLVPILGSLDVECVRLNRAVDSPCSDNGSSNGCSFVE